METRKLIVWGLFTFLLFLIGYLIYLLIFKNVAKQSKIPQLTPFPSFIVSPTLSQETTREKIYVGKVVVNDFYKIAQKVMPNGDVILSDNSDFQLVYFGKSDYFQLSINDSPFEEVKSRSENELLRILNINKEDACSLKLRITTPFYANPDFAGKKYSLSFCE